MSKNGKEKKAPPTIRRVGVAQPRSFLRDQEILRKENFFILEQFRSRGAASSNPAFRASHIGVPLFHTHSIENSNSNSNSNNNSEFGSATEKFGSLVDGGGKVLLSRGSLPSATLADYSKIPMMAEWNVAEKKHATLKNELDSLEAEISLREEALKTKITEDITSSTSPSMSLRSSSSERGSAVVGSTFSWGTERGKSTSQSDYSWPERQPPLYQITKTQYGDLSKLCDYLGPPQKIAESRAKSRGRGNASR